MTLSGLELVGNHLRRVFIFLSLAIGSVALSGCGMSQLASMLPGSSLNAKNQNKSWEPKVSEERLLAAAKTDSDGPVDMPQAVHGCPKFSIWQSDRELTVYEIGRVGDGLAIRHRGEITKTARECALAPGKITVKFGIAGRVLLGPKGKAGPVKLPVVIHVTGRTREKIKTQKLMVSVIVPPDRPFGYFSAVRRISFDLPPDARPQDFKIYVAFDRKAPGAG